MKKGDVARKMVRRMIILMTSVFMELAVNSGPTRELTRMVSQWSNDIIF